MTASLLRKLGVNLVPFPRLHFFLISQAQLQSKDNKADQLVNVQELTNQCFSPRNFFSNVKPDDFVEWIPNNMKTSVVVVPPKDAKQSCTFVANTQFGAMYKRKAFLHWYKGEGMDE